jgi:ankyrin repeat protein
LSQSKIELEGWNLHRAAIENRADIALALIARGDIVDALGVPPAKSHSRGGATPLYFAAANNSLGVALLLIDRGADVNNYYSLGRTTALHGAASYDSFDVANLLIDRGADIEAQDTAGLTPLHFAARNKSFDVARSLKIAGANTARIDLSWMYSEWHKTKRRISKWWKNSP